MQRYSLVLPAILLLLVSCSSPSVSADDIIERNIEARGGYDKVRSLRNVVFEGTTESKGQPVTVRYYYEHMRGMRSEFIVSGRTAYRIYTPAAGWIYNPFDTNGIKAIDEDEVKDAFFQLDIQGLFVDYKQKGYRAKYEGMDTALGKDCYKIRLIREGEGDKAYFFDKEYLLQKVITYRLASDGSYQPGVNYFLDYRKDANGYLFSFKRIDTRGVPVTFDKVTTNTNLPEFVFVPED